MNRHRHPDQGEQVNRTETSAKAPSTRTRALAARASSRDAKGAGAPSSRLRVGGRTPSLRLAALTAILTAAFLALGASSALAAPPASFGEEGPGAGQFSNPFGIAVEQETGDVYINDTSNARVDKFGSEGEFKLAFGWGVATGAEELQTCGPEATPPTITCSGGLFGSGSGQLSEGRGIAVDNSAGPSHGDVYVVGVPGGIIEKFKPNGEFLLAFAASPGGWDPIAVDSAGTVYVAGTGSVQKFSEAGAPEGEVAIPSAGNIQGLAVDSANDLYVVGEGQGGVHKYDGTGAELGEPRDPSAFIFFTTIAVGPADELLVEDGNSRRIDTFDPAGKQLSSFADPTSGATGIAFGNAIERLYSLHSDAVNLTAPPTPGTPLLLPPGEQATEIGTTFATLKATLNPEGGEETTYEFEYGTEASVYTESTPVTPLPVDELQTLTLTATEGTFTLSFEGEASAAVPFGAEASELQTALEAIPAIGTGNVSVSGPAGGPYAIEFTGALAETDVAELVPDPSGLGNFGEPGSASLTTTRSGGRFLDRAVSAPITGLAPRTTYHFRVVATNKAGKTTAGPDQTFETLPPVSIDSTSASLITATSAQLETELNPHGLPTTYHFEYDTVPYAAGEPGHGTSTPTGSAGSGESDVSRSAQLQGLQPATTYHYRVLATNSLGTVEGPDHAFTTQGPAGPPLPDGRGWEMVSPPEKRGIPLAAIELGDIQAAADGSGLTYVASGSINAEAPGNRDPSYSQLLSRRGPAGWSTRDITTQNEVPAGGLAGHGSEYQLFSPDLSLAAVEPSGTTPLSPQATEPTPYLRRPDGSFTPLVTAANVPPGTHFGSDELVSARPGVEFEAATPDLSHLVLTSRYDLSEPVFSGGGNSSLYEWTAGALALLSQVPAAPATVCGGSACLPAAEAGLDSVLGVSNSLQRHALSADGSRAVFGTFSGTESHLFLRDVGRGETLQLDAVQGGEGNRVDPTFQDASADGSRIFFTDGARLTAGSTANGASEPDLYMCEIEIDGEGHLACALKDLTVDHHPGQHASVQELVLGSAADGSALYFVANGALAPGAVNGNCEDVSGDECNLYRYDAETGETRFLAVLSRADRHDWGYHGTFVGLSVLTARVSPDGRWLAFMSERPLTGYDNRDAATGARDQEVFLYDAAANGGAGKLICASCNPSGARPRGMLVEGRLISLLVDGQGNWQGASLAASIPGWTTISLSTSRYQSRYLANSGRLFFNANDALVPQDSNGTEDVYQYEPAGVGGCTTSSPTYSPRSEGCADLISSGTSAEESAFLDASQSGNDVFFLTATQLSAADHDTALDVYDAHVCTAELPCPPPPPAAQPECAGDACQPPAVPPSDATPGSLTFNGAGNLVECPKGKVKKSGKCVARKHKKAHKKHGKKSHHRTAGHKRGGGK